MDWIQNHLWYGHANLDIRGMENVQNTRQNHKFHHECHGKLEGNSESGSSNHKKKKNYQRVIFLGDSLSSQLFVLISKLQETINHVIYMLGIKIVTKQENIIESLIHIIKIVSV